MVMTAGLATISGNTLVVYALIIAPVVPDAAGQLLTASLVSAPAAILAALADDPAGRAARSRPKAARAFPSGCTTARWMRWCAARRMG